MPSSKKSPLLLIALFGFTLIVYSPLILSPNKLLERGNDLQEQFWPVFYFIRNQFLETGSLPFWNNIFLSGTPILPDPQFSLFYPPNWLFIFLPTDYAFLVWLILHSALGGIGIFVILARLLKFSELVALAGAFTYISSPAVANFLEAGHYGLVGTYTWLPFLLLSVFNIAKQPKSWWLALGSVSLAGLFYTHTVIFLISTVSSAIFLVITLSFQKQKTLAKSFAFYLLMLVGALGLSAVTLLPQLDWSKETTRFLLLMTRETHPQWNGLADLLASFIPWLQGVTGIQSTYTEKWLALGPTTILLSFFGFVFVRRKIKLVILIALFVVLVVVANNLSPLYSFLLSFDFFVLARVSTRIWFIVSMLVILSLSFALERISKKDKKIFHLLTILLVLESVGIFWARTQKPIIPEDRFAPQEVYEYLSQDKGLFRVFCTTRCLSQKQAAIYRLQLVEGYNTLAHTNYFKHMWQITQSYWDYYTLAVPPPGIYKFGQILPDSKSLGEYNTKYVVSPYKIEDKNLVLQKTFQDYYIYSNALSKPRVYGIDPTEASASIAVYSPNHIKVNVAPNTKSIILAEIYSRGWRAHLSDGKEVPIQETPNALRLVDLPEGAKFVDFIYAPVSFKIGRLITLFTVFVIFVYFVRNKLVYFS